MTGRNSVKADAISSGELGLHPHRADLPEQFRTACPPALSGRRRIVPVGVDHGSRRGRRPGGRVPASAQSNSGARPGYTRMKNGRLQVVRTEIPVRYWMLASAETMKTSRSCCAAWARRAARRCAYSDAGITGFLLRRGLGPLALSHDSHHEPIATRRTGGCGRSCTAALRWPTAAASRDATSRTQKSCRRGIVMVRDPAEVRLLQDSHGDLARPAPARSVVPPYPLLVPRAEICGIMISPVRADADRPPPLLVIFLAVATVFPIGGKAMEISRSHVVALAAELSPGPAEHVGRRAAGRPGAAARGCPSRSRRYPLPPGRRARRALHAGPRPAGSQRRRARRRRHRRWPRYYPASWQARSVCWSRVRSNTARAVEASDLLCLSRAEFEGLCEAWPEAIRQLPESIAPAMWQNILAQALTDLLGELDATELYALGCRDRARQPAARRGSGAPGRTG